MNKKIAVSSLLVALAVPLSLALANTTGTQTDQNTPTVKTQWEQNKQELETQREKNKQALETQREKNKQAMDDFKLKKWQDRCKNIETRVDTRINRYQNNLKMFQNVFGNMKDRLTRLSTRLQTALSTAGITDNSKLNKLNDDIATLNTKTQKLKDDYAAFLTALNDAKSKTTACEQATITADQTTLNTGLVGKFGDARKALLLVQQDRLDIRNFYQKTIRPDLLAIRAQLPAKSTTDDKPAIQS